MEQNIIEYLIKVGKRHGNVSILKNETDNLNMNEIPNPLKKLYQNILEVELPFGRIFAPNIALEQSKNIPFYPDWFVFGKDNYFSFWLCSYLPDEEGLSFTYWDHGSGCEIDGAVWPDLESFLQDLEEEFRSDL